MTKSVDAGLGVGFSGVEPGGGKSRLVGTVGEVLGFETEAGLFVVGAAGFSCEAIEKISGVELYTGLGGEAGEGSSANRFDYFSSGRKSAVGAV